MLSERCGATEALSEPGCLKFELSPEGALGAIAAARERFRAGTLALTEPEKSVRYPYSLEKHVDALLALLG